MKLIFGTKALGIKIRIRKENKVSLSLALAIAHSDFTILTEIGFSKYGVCNSERVIITTLFI